MFNLCGQFQCREILSKIQNANNCDFPETRNVQNLLPPNTHTMRIPPAPPVSKSLELDLDLDQANAPPKELLLSNHLVKWWGVRKSWKKAASDNEKRYQKSLTVLKEMYEK